MKYLRQFMIILLVSFWGELLKYVIPLPVPASIYGLVILFILLETGILKLNAVKETSVFLIEIMPLMFIPAGVGLMESWGDLNSMLLEVVVIILVSTVLVMGVSGKVTELVLKRSANKKGETKDE
ncbi:Antiholin-like protein LrgA [uncultured Clostridium sp.]|uniref:CidA/LrgA family protein n=1 Tax=Muricoprocola aceti TaxID=2981772 RepID=A0ABT2SJL4_9FIRM|nr:CidA/LrgA family protein [Muricoprocola aceti]MCU6724460.1 CidA/LrgA family protein [Muricoprocola aceti]SCH13113.1 Antiholin-like protein LrgA [uncultured Clostridium sp.]